MNIDGSGQTNITNNSVADDYYSSFSPDGSKIVFNSDRDVDGNNEIYIMNFDGSGQVVRLTNNPAADEFPSFSP
jgi:Tol biopolymer transport system component